MKTWIKAINSFAMLLAMLCFCPSCSSSDEIQEPSTEENPKEETKEEVKIKARADIELTEVETQLAHQSADFSIRLLQAAEKTEDNKKQIVLSPLSASYALSMVSNGANGDTQQELFEALGFDGFSVEDINAFNKKLMENLVDLDNTAAVHIANSLWLNKDFKAKDAFKGTLVANYEAEVGTYDFGKPETKDLINEWCEEKTNGRIKDFITELFPHQRFVLLNAIYFKGGWKNEFKKVEAGKFQTEAGSQQDVDYLYMQENTYLYMENDQYALTELGYGNEAFGFVVLLPKEGKPIADVMGGLTGKQWLESVNAMKPKLLNVKLPKFKVEAKGSLKDVLKEIGIEKAFTAEADFSALSDDKTCISDVLQANYISIDEKGTEAAAVTGIVSDIENVGDSAKPIDFYVNRPFLYFIKEKSTNTILFIGKMGEIVSE